MPSNRREVKVYITGDETGFTKSIDRAEGRLGGMSGKMKGALAGVSVLAIGRGALNAANNFQEAAISANDFATASGLSVDAASRWQEVAGDLGVDSSKLETTIGRMSKTVGKDADKWEDLGLTIAKTDDGVTDVNGTFLNALQMLRRIEDPLERAQTGTELFGRSWMDMAPLLELSAEEVEASLSGVGEAQVIDPEEVEKAKRMRETMDNLNDSVGGLQMGLAEGLIPVISTFAEWIGALDPKMVGLGITVLGAIVIFGKLATAITGISGLLTILADHPVLTGIGLALVGIALIIQNWDAVSAAIQRAIDKVREFSAAVAGPVTGFLNKLPGVSIGESNFRDGLGPAALDYLESRSFGRRAAGGPVHGGSPYLVGERGPELFVPSGSGSIVANHDLGRRGSVNYFTINPAPGMDERQLARTIAREIDRQERAAGVATL